jgi:hypothetical protein
MHNLYKLNTEMKPLDRDLLVFAMIKQLINSDKKVVNINNCKLYKNYNETDNILVCNTNIVSILNNLDNTKYILALKISASYRFIMLRKYDIFILPTLYNIVLYDSYQYEIVNIISGTLCKLNTY